MNIFMYNCNMKLTVIFLFTYILSAQTIERTQIQMGTYANIKIAQEHQNLIQNGFNELQIVEYALSSYKETAEIYRLNKNKRLSISPLTYEALSKSVNYYQDTDGYFNITIGSITKELYHFGEIESIPKDEDIRDAQVDINGLEFNSTSAVLSNHTTLDLGGMGKGFGVDKVSNLFINNGVKRGYIALSGDIRCLDRCSMAIESPFKETVIATFDTINPNTSISTSGTYRRYVNNKEHHHLINPKSKRQSETFVSVTLISLGDNSKLDAYATAIGTMEQDEALEFLKSHPYIGYILIDRSKNIYKGNLENLIYDLNFITPF